MNTTLDVRSSVPHSFFRSNPPNAGRTMDALRDLGYDSYASVEDLIDNSIDAGAKRISVKTAEVEGDIVITIEDDGCGMDEDTLDEALRLGSDTSRESGDLGKFGMGLVTASIGLSQRVEVFTREEGGPALYGGFDLEEIREQDAFVKFVGVAPATQNRFTAVHGTLVALSKTDRISNRRPSDFAAVLRKRVGQIFRKFLKSGLVIEVNGQAAEPIDPLMLSHPDTRVVLEMELEIDHGIATVRAVELPDLGGAANKAHGINADGSGFYVLRNNREIMEAETFDFYKKHPEYSHFRAEISFNGEQDEAFHTDVKKKSIHPSQSFLDKLKQATMALITASQREKKRRSNTERGKVDHSAAESNIQRRAKLLPKPPTLLEKRNPKSRHGAHPTTDGTRKRTPHVTDLKTISGLKVTFNEADYGEGTAFYVVNQQGRTVTVTYNREHPFWRELVEHADDAKVIAILDYLVFAMANTELMVPEPASVVKTQVNATLVGLLV